MCACVRYLAADVGLVEQLDRCQRGQELLPVSRGRCKATLSIGGSQGEGRKGGTGAGEGVLSYQELTWTRQHLVLSLKTVLKKNVGL